MSLRDEILEGLQEYKVKEFVVGRDDEQNGLAAVRVSFVTREDRVKKMHDFSFAKDNHMDAADMVTVIRSYLESGTE